MTLVCSISTIPLRTPPSYGRVLYKQTLMMMFVYGANKYSYFYS